MAKKDNTLYYVLGGLALAGIYLSMRKPTQAAVGAKKKFDLGYYGYPTGTVIANRSVNKNSDYKKLAHVSFSGVVSYYDENLPESVKKEIENYADRQKIKEQIRIEKYNEDLALHNDWKRKHGFL